MTLIKQRHMIYNDLNKAEIYKARLKVSVFTTQLCPLISKYN